MTALDELDSDRDEQGEAPEHLWESREVRWSGLSGMLLLAGYVAQWGGAADGVSIGLWLASLLAGVRFFAAEVGIELLMTVAAVAAAVLGLWEEAAALAFLYSISEALEEFTTDRTRGAIRALMDLAPKRVRRLVDGVEEEIDLELLAVGDRFVVRPGEGIATDGLIVDGRSALSESVPVEKTVGDKVFAGTLNTTGSIVVETTATSVDNTLAKIVHLVTEAQEQKGRGERFMTRFSRRYSPAVLAAGVAIAIVGGIATGEWSTWAERAATVLVAAAPCALVIAIPITYVAAIGSASRRGILIKGGVYLEELAQVQVLALDKTGTLTQGRPQVVSVVPASGESEASLLAAAAAVEQRSEHPLARAVLARAAAAGIGISPVSDFEALIGAGACATVDGRRIMIGSPTLMTDSAVELGRLAEEIERLESSGQTVIVTATDDKALGLIGIADVLRPQASAAMADLHRVGIKRLVMLTGDNPRTAAAVAAQVGVDDFQAGLKPEDKSRIIGELTATYGHVAMVGDGVNDAPALAAASVGIAMGTWPSSSCSYPAH